MVDGLILTLSSFFRDLNYLQLLVDCLKRLAIVPKRGSVCETIQSKYTRAFNLGEGIVFKNYVNTLSDSNDEVQQSLQNLRISDKGQASSSNPKPRNADQIYVYKETDGI